LSAIGAIAKAAPTIQSPPPRSGTSRRDQADVDQLAVHGRPPVLDVEGRVERVADCAHHAARREDQPKDADHAEQAGVLRNVAERRFQRFPPGFGQRDVFGDEVDDVFAGGLRPLDQAERSGGEDDQREQREQRVVGDRRGQLRALIVEVLGHAAPQQLAQMASGGSPAHRTMITSWAEPTRVPNLVPSLSRPRTRGTPSAAIWDHERVPYDPPTRIRVPASFCAARARHSAALSATGEALDE